MMRSSYWYQFILFVLVTLAIIGDIYVSQTHLVLFNVCFSQMCFLIGTVSQVSNVVHGPIVYFTELEHVLEKKYCMSTSAVSNIDYIVKMCELTESCCLILV